jgi:glutaredoxin
MRQTLCPYRFKGVFILVFFISCAQEKKESTFHSPRIKITESNSNLLYIWFDNQGKFHTTKKISEIPKANRRYVRVEDISLSPYKKRTFSEVYVADLRRPLKDGTYSYRIMSRDSYEALVQRTKQVKTSSDKPRPLVILYQTAWCSICRMARDYLTKNKISFIIRDIEKDKRAKKELLKKLKSKGLEFQGVPVFDIQGRILRGFDPKEIKKIVDLYKRSI